MQVGFYDDGKLNLMKSSQEHIYCVNYAKCSCNGGITKIKTCKKFRNRFWSELSSFVNEHFILNEGRK